MEEKICIFPIKRHFKARPFHTVCVSKKTEFYYMECERRRLVAMN